MKIKTLGLSLFLMTFVISFTACNNDDDGTTTVSVRDREDQQMADKDSLIDYLSSHYYNSAFFETGVNHKFTDIIITELQEDETVPDGHTLLINAVGAPLTTTFVDTEYEYYVLRLNQGGGNAPKFTNQVRVRYEGISMETGDAFETISVPNVLALQGNSFTTFSAIRAWQLVMPTFNSAFDFGYDSGNVVFNNYGLGVMFVPSGLGFFSATNTGRAYDNLIFKFELLQQQEEDHDSDGIPSYIEDLDDDNDVFDNDTDEDGLANFIDLDDDGDGVNTNDELSHTQYIVDTNLGESEPVLGTNEFEVSKTEVNGVITIDTITLVDSNNDGLFDYLDPEIAVNNNEE